MSVSYWCQTYTAIFKCSVFSRWGPLTSPQGFPYVIFLNLFNCMCFYVFSYALIKNKNKEQEQITQVVVAELQKIQVKIITDRTSVMRT